MPESTRHPATVANCRGHSPTVIQADKTNLYVGRYHHIRAGKFAGEVWRPQGWGNIHRPDASMDDQRAALVQCIERYEQGLARQALTEPRRMLWQLKLLHGHKLWCWCCEWDGLAKPRPLCHAAVLADWTNRMARGERPWEQFKNLETCQ